MIDLEMGNITDDVLVVAVTPPTYLPLPIPQNNPPDIVRPIK